MCLSWLFGRRSDKDRAKVVEEARRAPFLDAVFLIHHCNTDSRRWWPDPKPPEIMPEEVFGSFDRAEYEEALEKVRKMRSDASYTGMAYHHYAQVKHSFAQARRLLRRENPGFAERSYELATDAAITDMR
jgi:hypothetical protein